MSIVKYIFKKDTKYTSRNKIAPVSIKDTANKNGSDKIIFNLEKLNLIRKSDTPLLRLISKTTLTSIKKLNNCGCDYRRLSFTACCRVHQVLPDIGRNV